MSFIIIEKITLQNQKNNNNKPHHCDCRKHYAVTFLNMFFCCFIIHNQFPPISYSSCIVEKLTRTCDFSHTHTQIDLARPNAMYATNSMYIANSATGVIPHPAQLPTTFPPPPAVFANRPAINLINASNDTTNDANNTITTTASSNSNSISSSSANKRDISTDTTVSHFYIVPFHK